MRCLIFQSYEDINEVLKMALDSLITAEQLKQISFTSDPSEFEQLLREFAATEPDLVVVTSEVLYRSIMDCSYGSELVGKIKELKSDAYVVIHSLRIPKAIVPFCDKLILKTDGIGSLRMANEIATWFTTPPKPLPPKSTKSPHRTDGTRVAIRA
jgi:hypothetical protein